MIEGALSRFVSQLSRYLRFWAKMTRARNVYTVSGVRVCVDREDGGLPGAVGVCGALSVCVGTCVCVWVW